MLFQTVLQMVALEDRQRGIEVKIPPPQVVPPATSIQSFPPLDVDVPFNHHG